MSDRFAERLMGGSPLAVIARLAVASLIVGAVLSWLQIDLADLVAALERGFVELWGSGFDALVHILRTLLAGAAVVVPVWVLSRLFGHRAPRMGRSGDPRSARWPDADRMRGEPRV